MKKALLGIRAVLIGSANGRVTILNSVLKNNGSDLGGGVGVYPGAPGVFRAPGPRGEPGPASGV